MSREHEGFTDITIPEQKFRSCSRCKFYSHSMVRSGNNPIYANHCTHTDFQGENFGMPHKLTQTRNGYVVTPDWCPFLKTSEKA
jgi:hypothetical protein